MSGHFRIHSVGMLTPPDEPASDECPGVFLIGDADAIRSVAQFMGGSVAILPTDQLAELRNSHRSFPEAADGAPTSPMMAELWAAGCNQETARFVAAQLAREGYSLVRADELARLRSLNAELVEALEVIIGRSRFDSEEEWMDFIDAVDEGRRILSRARAKEDT